MSGELISGEHFRTTEFIKIDIVKNGTVHGNEKR